MHRGVGSATCPSGLDGSPVGVDERVDASLATATWAMVHGARMVRAHDVSVTAQAATIVSGGFPVS